MKTVYVIEDDTLMAEHIARQLSDYKVKIFTNGIDAMNVINQQLPDAIILDIILDGPSGFSLLNELSSYIDTAKIPIIICSSIAAELTANLESYGVVAILDKTTMLPKDLYHEVYKWIQEPKQ